MPTELHMKIVNALWRGLRNLEVMDELQDPRGLNLTLNDTEEHEVEKHIHRLRREIQEARELAPAAAEQMFREGGCEFREVVEALSSPCLLSSFEVVGIVSRAQAVVKAEQEA